MQQGVASAHPHPVNTGGVTHLVQVAPQGTSRNGLAFCALLLWTHPLLSNNKRKGAETEGVSYLLSYGGQLRHDVCGQESMREVLDNAIPLGATLLCNMAYVT